MSLTVAHATERTSTGQTSESGSSDSEMASEMSIRLVAFEAAGALFGAPIADVQEIRAWAGSTSLPNTAPFLRGVINLRGAIIPIVDFARRLGQSATQAGPTHVVMILAAGEKWVGLLVDAVSDIVVAPLDSLAAPPENGAGAADPIIASIASLDGRLLPVIDPKFLLEGSIPLQ